MTMNEIAPGVHRIESDLGSRFMAQYVLVGEDRSVLLDTGVAATPDAVLIPALEELGVDPDLILISHADLDHCGGNRTMRARYPSALFGCHELDRHWVQSNQAMLAENYLWYEAYGFEKAGEQERRELLAELGGDCPIDLGLRGGETIRLGSGRCVEVLHLPGHTPGHIALWEPRSQIAIMIDAALLDGIYDRSGNKLIPPRYYDAEAYRATIRRIRALEPELLLTAHYQPMSAEPARAFCDRSLAFVDAVEAAVRECVAAGDTSLREVTERVDQRLGPFPYFSKELGAGVRSHLSSAV
jgi:glyoxylase-like metal-dependent hydrolase (beta-lactamase superfamily II)